MPEVTRPSRRIAFGQFQVDFEGCEIRKRGVRIALQSQPFQVLEMLLTRPGEIVTRAEVKTRLWSGDDFGDFDHSINKAINKLREALNDSAANPRYIETVAKRGYRFIAAITMEDASPDRVEPPPQIEPPVSQGETSKPPAIHVRGHIPTRIISVAAAALLALSVAVLLFIRAQRDRNLPSGRTIRSLAVLPLENLSSDAAQEYFTDGMTEEMITALGNISSLRVISRTSSMEYKHTHKSLPEVARELGVDAVLEGTVLRVGSTVRITAQLIRAATDEHLWSHSYQGDLRDTLQLQDSVARRVAESVRVKITPAEQFLLREKRPVDSAAHDAYLKGRYFWNKRTGQALTKAVDYFNQAISLDPGYAEAYSGLADSYALLGDWEFGSLSPSEAFPKAEVAAAKALEIDSNLGAAHASLALCLKIFDWKWQTSEHELIRAIQLNPSYASAHQWYGWLLILLGRTDEGIRELKTALSLDPLSLIIGTDLADALLITRKYDESVRQSRRVIEMDPTFSMAHYQLAQAYAQMHRYNEGLQELEQAISLSGRNPLYVAHLGYIYALSGKQAKALQTIDELQKPRPGRYFNPADVALIHVGLQQKNEAFAWLEKAYDQRFNPSTLRRPAFDTLRTDPRFLALLRRIGLAQ